MSTPTPQHLERARVFIEERVHESLPALRSMLVRDMAQELADERERTQKNEWAAWATWCEIRAEGIAAERRRVQSPGYWAHEGMRRAYLHVASCLRRGFAPDQPVPTSPSERG